jgi:uncharacterized protein (TIGR02466 family)
MLSIMPMSTFFPTSLYRAPVLGTDTAKQNEALAHACRDLAKQDRAGQNWCKANGYKGYTSYASLNDLPERDPDFGDLARKLDRHVKAFAEVLEFDLGGKKLKRDSFWVNILPKGGVHTGHIHPHSVVSGTYYVDVPEGSSALKLEDPRLAMMMAAPPRRADASLANRSFVLVEPKAGEVLLWESWLRHEVPLNQGGERISISFNYRWG